MTYRVFKHISRLYKRIFHLLEIAVITLLKVKIKVAVAHIVKQYRHLVNICHISVKSCYKTSCRIREFSYLVFSVNINVSVQVAFREFVGNARQLTKISYNRPNNNASHTHCSTNRANAYDNQNGYHSVDILIHPRRLFRNSGVNIIGITACADYPVERLKIQGVVSLR